MKECTLEDRRKDKRTLDKVLEDFRCENADGEGVCGGGNGDFCNEHVINKYRIKLLEDAKDALCLSAEQLSTAQTRNSTMISVAGVFVSLCAAGMLVVTGLGWKKMGEFSERVYKSREKDLISIETYKRDAQAVHNRHEHVIDEIVNDLAMQSKINVEQTKTLEKLSEKIDKIGK